MKSNRHNLSLYWLISLSPIMVIFFILVRINFVHAKSSLTEIAQTNANNAENQLYDIQQIQEIPLYPQLIWSKGIPKTQMVALDGYDEPKLVSGIYYQSETFPVIDKPPREFIDYYSPLRFEPSGWKFLNYIDQPNSIGFVYLDTAETQYLSILIQECLSDTNIPPGFAKPATQYCIKIWMGSIPSPKIMSNIESEKNSENQAQISVNYTNPLPVPFYSQRNSDPANSIILGFGSSCTLHIYGYGCALTAHTMIYNYFQPNYKSVIELNDSMKIEPGVYSCSGGCCNLWPISAPDAPTGVTFAQRYTNDCTSANCIDTGNVIIIDNAINAGRPLHARVHPTGGEYNSHSIVIIGHVGSTYYIKDPWATDDTQRTLTSGALGSYVVDFIDTYNGTPPGGGSGIPLPTGTTFCANEGGYCSFTGTATVYYGANNSYYYKENVTSGINCNNDTFGDPAYGYSKACYYKITSQPCSPTADQAALYTDANYGGSCVVKNIGDYSNPSSIGLANDSISSLKVGSNVKLTLCGDDNYLGTCETFTGDDSDLSNNSIGNDQASSAKVENRSSFRVLLYADPNYSGAGCGFTSAGAGNVCSGFNDVASSILISSGWSARVWVDSDFVGASRCFTSSTPDFSGLQYNENGSGYINDSISSFAAYNQTSCPPLVNPPSAPTLISPANGASYASNANISVSWNSSSGASEYYAHLWGVPSIDINSGWTSNTNWSIGTLWPGTYQWQVKARNSAGESSWSSTWSFSIYGPDGYEVDDTYDHAKTINSGSTQTHNIVPIGDVDWVTFTLSAPSGVTLRTSGNTNADTVIYLYDQTLVEKENDDDDGDGLYSFIQRSCGVNELIPGTYYLKVVDFGNDHLISSYNLDFNITEVCTPGGFNKSNPSNTATGVSITPTLSWGSASGATFYEYCYDTTNDNACSSWTSNGTSTSKAITGLSYNTTYYWHVRALNSSGTTYSNGSETAFWTFTTQLAPPGVFHKTGPVNGTTNVSISPTLGWETSTGATSYEYCYDTTNDNSCAAWTSNGTSTSKSLSGLNYATTYYWHVRAVNSTDTTYSNGSSTAFWSFTTQIAPPGSFSKASPSNSAVGISTSPTLSWESSSGATLYEYCYDTTNDNTCSSWTSNGTATTKSLSGLSYATTYYWHVRAVNSTGTTYSNSSSSVFWSFTTQVAPPAAFSKISPIDGSNLFSNSPNLSWGSSNGATSYEYCYDTTNDNSCSSWVGIVSLTSVSLSGLSPNATYYWQVRAINSAATTYANNGVWWSFTITEISPGNGEILTTSKVAFNWSDVSEATSYKINLSIDPTFSTKILNLRVYASEYAFDTFLSPDTTYYWRIRPFFGDVKGTWSETFHFKSMDPLTAPALTYPAPKQEVTSPLTFTWDPVANAVKYKLLVATDALFLNRVVNIKITEPFNEVNLPPGKYFWRVRAIDASGGKGPWSEVRIFKVTVTP